MGVGSGREAFDEYLLLFTAIVAIGSLLKDDLILIRVDDAKDGASEVHGRCRDAESEVGFIIDVGNIAATRIWRICITILAIGYRFMICDGVVIRIGRQCIVAIGRALWIIVVFAS